MNDEQRYYEERDVALAMNKELTKNDILKSLATSEEFGDFESAGEKKASLEFEKALKGNAKDNKSAIELSNLACDWYSEGRISGFKAGFQMATKLFVAGMG
jgi:hypothetical protein